MHRAILLPAMILLLATGPLRAAPASEPSTINTPDESEDAAIREVLDIYARSVSTGDQAAFESQLLDLKIPFSYANEGAWTIDRPDLAAIQDYTGFRKTIFDGGKRYKQRFSNIKIEQVGNLAQVSLDYETALRDEAYDGKGWKVMHLIKLNGRWKIASEFFTGYPRH